MVILMKVGIITMLLKSDSFKKEYKNKVVEIKNLSVNSKFIHIKGENGSGKSTFIKALTALISYQGDITFPHTYSYMPEIVLFTKDITVIEYIDAFMLLEEYKKENIYELIDVFDIADKINEPVKALSKGMKMKLQLLLCLMIKREVYILDEPFSGLNEESIMKLLAYMKESNKEYIVSSHLDVKKMCDLFEVIHI